MRFTRLIIGFLVIVVAILVIAGEQLSGASADDRNFASGAEGEGRAKR